MAKKSVITIQDRFASQYDANLNKFSPKVLAHLVEEIEDRRANVDILVSALQNRVDNVWTTAKYRNIAEDISDAEKSQTKILVKGKGAGNVANVWTNVKTFDALRENYNAVDRLQEQINQVKAIGTDESVKATRKGRSGINGQTVKFVENVDSNVDKMSELVKENRAYAVYCQRDSDNSFYLAGWNVIPQKRATK